MSAGGPISYVLLQENPLGWHKLWKPHLCSVRHVFRHLGGPSYIIFEGGDTVRHRPFGKRVIQMIEILEEP